MDSYYVLRVVHLRIGLVLLFLTENVRCNVRCYSCAPCNEFDYFAGSLYHFEADCYLDRYCMKVTGRTTDIFGYQQEINFRGCPWISVLATLEEGCTESAIAVAGAGVVEGIFCLCRDHLCNSATNNNSNINVVVSAMLSIITVLYGYLSY